MTTASRDDAAAPDIHTTAGKLADLRNRLEETKHPVGEAAVEKTHARGKLTARERITHLLDEGSFVEYGSLALAAQRSRRSEPDRRPLLVVLTDGRATGGPDPLGRTRTAARMLLAGFIVLATMLASGLSHTATSRTGQDLKR